MSLRLRFRLKCCLRYFARLKAPKDLLGNDLRPTPYSKPR
jgi:hypothetical protein